MATLGHIADRDASGDTLARARARAALIPDLLVEARRIANTVISGWHGRRKRGIGDNFWQFRPYVAGESLSKVDWRRSARDDHIYIKDREWEAAHTVWVWADSSPSMLFRSDLAQVSKQSRALVLALAVCEILSRSGERLGWPGVTDPVSSRNATERIATDLALSDDRSGFPAGHEMKKFSDIVLISDFLDPVDEIIEHMDILAERGLRGHLVHMIDPAEETFPYAGRTEFRDPETGERLTAGRAETYRDEFQTLFSARQSALRSHATRLGWSHILHHTDRPASEALVALHTNLSGTIGYASRPAS